MNSGSDRKPRTVFSYYTDGKPGIEETQDVVPVPAMGSVALQVIW